MNSQTDNHQKMNSDDHYEIEKKLAEVEQMLESTDLQAAQTGSATESANIDLLFRTCLLNNISEGVVFVNQGLEITNWNKSAEAITGLGISNILGMKFSPDLIGLKTKDGELNGVTECPVAQALISRQSFNHEYSLIGRSGREAKIELSVTPVFDLDECLGCVVLLQDLTASADLKRQISYLQNANTMDPLTHVANRAEFERSLREYVSAHRVTDSNCSLIVCDIDFFKKVNDTYGHHVGDQALVAFAQTLKQFVRTRDIVARYGGEEFVILCANCDLQSAVQRAEQIRVNLNQTPQQMLDGKTLSASFGVAELKADEDVTDFFVRADKALFAAKQAGRNRVKKASDAVEPTAPERPNFEVSPTTGVEWRKWRNQPLFCEEYCTTTSSDMLANKLRGFITECVARPLHVEQSYASVSAMAVDANNPSKKTWFRVDVEFQEPAKDSSKNNLPETYIRITIFNQKQGLFGRVHEDLHKVIVTDLRRFLMITDDSTSIKLNPAATSSGRDEE